LARRAKEKFTFKFINKLYGCEYFEFDYIFTINRLASNLFSKSCNKTFRNKQALVGTVGHSLPFARSKNFLVWPSKLVEGYSIMIDKLTM
jgi:hypothetical protein